MRILGIDPGLRITGYGLIETKESQIKMLEAGVITPNAKEGLEGRIHTIYKNLDDLISEYNPEVMVLEKLYAHARHPTTACLLGHVRGVICLLCAERKMKFVEHSVKRIRKAILGAGGASKLQTQGMVAHILGIDKEKLTVDASDALALALGYAQSANNRL